MTDRFLASFAARNWDAMTELLTDDTSTNDRRPLVGVGFRGGRDEVITDWRATAEVGVKNVTFAVVATRGERLALTRLRFMGRDERPEAFRTDVLGIAEIDTERRIAACVMFDVGDIDAAFAELEARYRAGEAASYAHTWALIAGALAGVNRHELPELAPDWVNIDHRRAIAFAPGEMTAYVYATWDQGPDGKAHIESVHRLSKLGAVVTQVGHEISPKGFEAEWRMLNLLTVEGDRFNRCELFDEEDLDAALARFDELGRPTPRLENAASIIGERYLAQFIDGDWDAMAQILAEDFSTDDRRRVVGAGARRGRDAEIADMRAIADLGLTNARRTAVLATREGRLVLSRVRFSGREHGPEAVITDILAINETNADNRIAATVVFDPDDLDAAFDELDARYLAGEAAAHAQTWSVITDAYAAFNRRELPATAPDMVRVDHRRVVKIDAPDAIEFMRAVWDLTPEIRIHIEAVHRLTDLGGVVTHAAHGITPEGFDAEWRMIFIYTVDGDQINRWEIFDETDVDAAIARFDELSTPVPRVDNVAIRAWSLCVDAINRGDADGSL